MELLIVRHAITQWNRERRYQGRTDIPLSEEGRLQAISWRRYLPGRPDWIWSSPLQRARETAELLYPNLPIHLHEGLQEMHLGSWEGKTASEIQAKEWSGWNEAEHGGETVLDVMERLKVWLRQVELKDGGVAVVVTHKAAAHSLFALATGWKMEGKPPVKMEFPRLHRFSWNGEKLEILSLNESLGED